MTNPNERLLVFAGSYAESTDNGVYVYSFDEATGELTQTDAFMGLKNPTFLNIDAPAGRLYAIGEAAYSDGTKIGEASSFAIDPAKGSIHLLNRLNTVGAPTCHIQRSDDSKYLSVTSYHGGMVGLFAIREDGQIGESLDVQQHEGHSVHPNQDRPHPHSSFYDPTGKYVLVQDLGLDRIYTYALDQEEGKLERVAEQVTAPGAGPRHLVFHPNGKYAFVINELNSTVTAYQYDGSNGTLSEIHSISTLPADYEGENGCAEIAISKDGRFVYGSNRGHDSIVQYEVDQATGQLTLVQHVSTEGGHPRHFSLTPNGNYLLAANRDGNNIVTFTVDAESGKLTYTGKSVEVSKPVCVWSVYM